MFRNIRYFFSQNKIIFYLIIGMILLLCGLFGYKTFYSNPENVVKFSTYGGNDSSEVEKTISKQSKLGNKLPYAEEIITELNDNEDVDKENFDIVFDKYGEEVASLYEVGLIPSSLLDTNDNIQIILSGNSYLEGAESNYYAPDYLINTFAYMESLGDVKPRVSENPASKINLNDISYEFANINNTLENGDIIIQGAFLTKPDVENGNLETYLLATNKLGETPDTVENKDEVINSIKDNYILTINFVINKNMKISKILDELSSMKMNDGDVALLNFDNLSDEVKSSIEPALSELTYLKETKGEDYEIASYSVLQVKYYTTDNTKIYSNSNYLSIKDNQIELSSGSVEFTNDLLYNEYEF